MANWNSTLQGILNGQVLTGTFFRRQYKVLILISVGIFLYIWAGIRAQREHHHLTELRKQLQDAQFEQLTIHANLTDLTKQSEVAAELKERGSKLSENTKPVIAIE